MLTHDREAVEGAFAKQAFAPVALATGLWVALQAAFIFIYAPASVASEQPLVGDRCTSFTVSSLLLPRACHRQSVACWWRIFGGLHLRYWDGLSLGCRDFCKIVFIQTSRAWCSYGATSVWPWGAGHSVPPGCFCPPPLFVIGSAIRGFLFRFRKAVLDLLRDSMPRSP